MKKTLIYLGVFVVIIIMIVFVLPKDKTTEVVEDTTEETEAIGMCYQYDQGISDTFSDRAWLKMSIMGDKLTGEYQNLPAEKDSKVGVFSGSVGPMDPQISARTADVWWESYAEGMNVTEQLQIQFGEGSAVALFGEMVDRGDGVYVYKDTTKLSPGFQMSQTDCEALDDKIIVEKYIRENIKDIAPEQPVLGGTWYANVITINPSLKTGTMTYEDGHIQGKASFTYTRNGQEISISAVEAVK